MPDLATKNVVVSETTHSRLERQKSRYGWASFDITISRAVALLEKHDGNPSEAAWSYPPAEAPEPPQNAPTDP